jgi:acyl-CoA dehydrogenase
MWNLFLILALIIYFYILISYQASIEVFSISYLLVALGLYQYTDLGWFSLITMTLLFCLFCIGVIKPLRRNLITAFIFKVFSKNMPSMSATERQALEAGTVSWEGDLFSGNPDFQKLLQAPTVNLTKEEQAFMEGPVNALCRMIDDWTITHIDTDLSESLWTFIKENRFFGMNIPKEYGGLDFSATAQASILSKICGRSVSVSTTISVPNSLGPAELLVKYGTQKQKDHYLPRLADGREIPCFALTNPNAGSDAASIPDTGIVCTEVIDGQSILGIRLSWDKRYITLCPVATVIGLAFRLFDPDNLLGKGKDVGISCALIPANTKGVITGRRHFPLNMAFLNGPTQGKNVFIPIDYLIGGVDKAGLGWRMLMECLSAGRAISLPSSSAGGSQFAALVTGAYSRVRKQFNQPLANFEGIEEPLARIAGYTYIINAGLTMTAAAIDLGAKPSVAGAILKSSATEKARLIALDAMDIHGGKGICLGPNNYIGRGFQSAPIAITVEGANILTRSLIIFGQGALRCHPYIFQELETVKKQDLTAFDRTYWSHFGFFLANFAQSLFFSFTDAYVSHAPQSKAKRYYQLIHKYSANLAFLTDFSMTLLGGELKRKEKISARLADMITNLYLASSVLKRFHEDNEPDADLPLVEWCCQQLLYESEQALQGVIVNLPSFWVRLLLKFILLPLGKVRKLPSDSLGKKLALILSTPNETRDRLTSLVFKEALANCPAGRLETAFLKLHTVEDLERKVAKAAKDGDLQTLTLLEQIIEAEQNGILDPKETLSLLEAERARQAIIAVDDFKDEELRRENKQTKKSPVSEKSQNNATNS